jgi:hypothetical protein
MSAKDDAADHNHSLATSRVPAPVRNSAYTFAVDAIFSAKANGVDFHG